jgi:exodeoxyribonuclease VII large subunit
MDAVKKPKIRLGVSGFIALTNQTLEYAYPSVEVEGEVSGFKLSQGKYVFFDLKDEGGTVGCFMMAWQLRLAIEDGMRVVVTASPKLTQWGKFSLTVRSVVPSGEGSLKKSFELLRSKLEKEGLFSVGRKRPLPELPTNVAIITSTEAAGYADFVRIINDRWGGLSISVAHVHVQGAEAPDQMIKALKYFNERPSLPEVIVLLRGGGSADDLAAFNDELLVREIATSRVPTLVGVGHEVDVTLADLAADVRAATPSNAAQLLVPDRYQMIRQVRRSVTGLLPRVEGAIVQLEGTVKQCMRTGLATIEQHYDAVEVRLAMLRRVAAGFDPQAVLAKGYAVVRGTLAAGQMIEIEKLDTIIKAEVVHVERKQSNNR